MILDTNAVSAFFEEVPAVCMTLGGCEVLAAPSIVLGEYRFGLSKETNRKLGMWRLSQSLRPNRSDPIAQWRRIAGCGAAREFP